jgi:hypothetical protein
LEEFSWRTKRSRKTVALAAHGLLLRAKRRRRDGVTYCALLFVVILLSFAAVPASGESPHTATVSMRPSKGARMVVAVKLNGAGPYDFMVDTGINAAKRSSVAAALAIVTPLQQ